MTTVQISDLSIANMALNLIGSSQNVQSLTPPFKTNEAQQLAYWYFFCRDAELTDWPYPFATVYAQLNQVAGPTPTSSLPANPEWLYAYRTPPDCLAIRRLVLGNLLIPPPIVPPMTGVPSQVGQGCLVFARQDGDPTPQPYEEAVDGVGKLILTDAPNACIRYTTQQQNAAVFNYPFAQTLAHRTAIMLYPLTRDEKRRQENERMYEHWKTIARAKQLNDTQNDQPFVDYNSEFFRGRFIG